MSVIPHLLPYAISFSISMTIAIYAWRRRNIPGAFPLLSRIPFLLKAIDIPYCHHEKWDGTGYPRQLKADEIPTSARIFTVVDVWDAVQSNRPYIQG